MKYGSLLQNTRTNVIMVSPPLAYIHFYILIIIKSSYASSPKISRKADLHQSKSLYQPCDSDMIKEQFRLLTPANRESVLKFDKSFAVNSDTFISRFSTKSEMQCSLTQLSALAIKLGSTSN